MQILDTAHQVKQNRSLNLTLLEKRDVLYQWNQSSEVFIGSKVLFCLEDFYDVIYKRLNFHGVEVFLCGFDECTFVVVHK